MGTNGRMNLLLGHPNFFNSLLNIMYSHADKEFVWGAGGGWVLEIIVLARFREEIGGPIRGFYR